MGRNLIDGRPIDIAAAKDQGGGYVTLITEKTAFQHRTSCHHATVGMSTHAQQLKFARNELGDLLGVSCSSSSAAVHIRSEIVDLFAVLLCDFGIGCGTSIGSQYDTVLEDYPDDCCSGFHRLR